MYCLEVVSDVPRGASSYYCLCIRQPYTVGRLDTCDIHFNTQDVSRVHASLQVVLTKNVEYAYSRTGASPFRPPVSETSPGRSFSSSPQPAAAEERPLFEAVDEDDAQPPLALVVTNQSKFGTAVDGTIVTGSCVVPNGGIVCFGSVGLRATYRPIVVSINPDCYDASHRVELEDMMTQLGAMVTTRPGEERDAVELLAAAAERRTAQSWVAFGGGRETAVLPMHGGGTGTPPRGVPSTATPQGGASVSSMPALGNTGGTWTSNRPSPTTSKGGDFESLNKTGSKVPPMKRFAPAIALAALYVTELIDEADTTIDALVHNHSMVLPAFIFELFAALADRCSRPLHTLPKPLDYEPPRSTDIYKGTTYLRPETKSVPFSLFATAGLSAKTTGRNTLLQNRMFTIHNEALNDKLAPVLKQCGAIVVPWQGAMDYTRYEAHGDDDPAELPRDDDEDFYDAVGLGKSSTPEGQAALSGSPQFRSRRAMLMKFKDRRFAIAARGELLALRDESITACPPPDAPLADHAIYSRVATLRDDWVLMAKNGWCVLSHECILRALLSNQFVPMPELPTEAEQYNSHLAPSDDGEDDNGEGNGDGGSNGPLAMRVGKQHGGGADGGDRPARDDDSDATPSDLGSDEGENPNPIRAALRRLARESSGDTKPLSPVKENLTKSLSSAARTIHNPQHFPSGSGGPSVEAWVAAQKATTASAAARSSQAFDMRLHRLQMIVDRTISVCLARVDEIVHHYDSKLRPTHHSVRFSAPPRQTPLPPPATTVSFLRNVIDKAAAHLQELETLSQEPEGQQRSLAIQGQWDVCEKLQAAALRALDMVVQHAGDARGGVGGSALLAHHRAPAERTPQLFRGVTTAADAHVIPARDDVAQRLLPTPQQRGRSRSPAASTKAHTTASEGSQRSSVGTSRRSLAGSLCAVVDYLPASRAARDLGGDDAAAVAPIPASDRGLRDRSRWARYLPAAPVHAMATPPSAATLQDGAKKAHHALLVHLSPSDLPRISRHRRLFMTKFGAREGEVRFNMWLTSQTPQWSASFFKTLEESDLTLQQFIRNSA
jgi:hypothetical protein